MLTALIILLFVIAIVCGIADSSATDNLRQYFAKSHPQEWEEFQKSKPKHFVPGRGQQVWSWNTEAMNQFIEKDSSLARDEKLRRRLLWIQRFRVIAISAIVIVFVLILITKFY